MKRFSMSIFILCIGFSLVSCSEVEHQRRSQTKDKSTEEDSKIALFDSKYGKLCDLEVSDSTSKVFYFDDSPQNAAGLEIIFYHYEYENNRAILNYKKEFDIDSLNGRLFLYEKDIDDNLITYTGHSENFLYGNHKNHIDEKVLFNSLDGEFYISSVMLDFNNGNILERNTIHEIAKVKNCIEEVNPEYYELTDITLD